jgi:type I restriction enzyme S subunit
MTEWGIEAVEDCLLRFSLRTVAKLQTHGYRTTGLYPIIDQGQALIAGWTDDSSGLISTDLPVIVFGDHTRVFKFIDFPFVRGADGTQILKPKAGIDPLYFYYACRAIDLPSRGYNRHFKLLKEKEILVPPEEEQRCIAKSLKLLDKALTLQDAELQATDNCKRAAMRALFTRGLRGEAQKETEFGPAPENWDEVPLDDCAAVQTGAAKGRKFSDAETVEVPYLRVANVQDGHLDLSEMKEIRIRRTEIERYRLQPDDVVLTEGGDFDKLGRGFVWRGELDVCVHQNHVFAVRTHKDRLLPDFFAYLAQSAYGKAYFLKVAHKTTNLACINSTKLKAFPVLMPPTLDEQLEIVGVLDALDRKIDLHRRKRAVLDDLFKALLHKLMTGEIRVADLDLLGLAPEPIAEVAA